MSDILEARRGAAAVQVHPLGATVLSYRPQSDEDALWVSPNATFHDGTAIRGGIPICWPWFAKDRPGPSHGFARTLRWTPLDAPDGAIRLELVDTPATHVLWPHAFRLQLEVRLTDRLVVTLTHENRSNATVLCTGALHSYLRVDDLRSARILGLNGMVYRDRVVQERGEQEGPLSIDGELDRIYSCEGPVALMDGARVVRVEGNTGTVVVWNPGPQLARSKPDLGEGLHERFVCVETAVTGAEVAEIAPGATYTLQTSIHCP
jgi:glucose-6-phosphate 1-epimerase